MEFKKRLYHLFNSNGGFTVLWVIMYFLGSLGKKRGHKQMDELHGFMMKTLKS